ncbi:MAG: class I SAM-dependent methyltransferase [Verrucomicrobiota bacterium]
MNKYLRNWMMNSNVPFLRNIAIRSVRKTHAKRHAAHQQSVYNALYSGNETPRVLNGPFAGMLYLNEPVWGSITPRWIGCYERALWPIVNDIIKRGYSRVIDVGCAEGYYAAGLCRALPGVEVFAFDMDPESQCQLDRLWKLNSSPGNLHINGLLDHDGLASLGISGSLLICDIEGGEMDLLNPVECPTLTKLDVLVEVHETATATVADNVAVLKGRFALSHSVEILPEQRDSQSLQGVHSLSPEALKKATSEGRPYEQVWLWMRARD